MGFVRYWLRTIGLMARVAERWELGFLATLPILIVIAAVPRHSPHRVLGAVVMLLLLVSLLGSLFIIDNLHGRADNHP